MSTTFTPVHGVSLEAFKKLATCATEPLHNGKEWVDACVSSWALWKEWTSGKVRDDMGWGKMWGETVGGAYTRDSVTKLTQRQFDEHFGDVLLSNVAFIALNASEHEKDAYLPYEYFHTGLGEDYRFRKIIKANQAFRGAYITDILKVENMQRKMFIQTDSNTVAKKARQPEFADALYLNFEILLHELEVLRGEAKEGPMLLVPLGDVAREQLEVFFAWLHGKPQAGEYVRPKTTHVCHYSKVSNNEALWPLGDVAQEFAKIQQV